LYLNKFCELARFGLTRITAGIKCYSRIYKAHGPVARFVSDNGTNFVGAAKIFKEDFENTRRFFIEQPAKLKERPEMRSV
jgi:hypothetical protein